MSDLNIAQNPFKELNTSYLHLRQLRVTDWEAVSYLRTDPEINKLVKSSCKVNKEIKSE